MAVFLEASWGCVETEGEGGQNEGEEQAPSACLLASFLPSPAPPLSPPPPPPAPLRSARAEQGLAVRRARACVPGEELDGLPGRRRHGCWGREVRRRGGGAR
jgi:hypothetical protein